MGLGEEARGVVPIADPWRVTQGRFPGADKRQGLADISRPSRGARLDIAMPQPFVVMRPLSTELGLNGGMLSLRSGLQDERFEYTFNSIARQIHGPNIIARLEQDFCSSNR